MMISNYSFGTIEDLSFLIYLFPLVGLFIACATTTMLPNKTIVNSPKKFESIEGLRGILAFFVFCHHTMVWFQYIKSGTWTLPTSHIFSFLGNGSVIIFFMITGLLFYDKLMVQKDRFDWLQLCVSRILRISPLYVTSKILTFIFGITLLNYFMTHINHFESLAEGNLYFTAGVTWTLPYEWFYYCSLPLIAYFMFKKPPIWTYLALIYSAFFLSKNYSSLWYLLAFSFGIAAAYATQSKTCVRICKSLYGTLAFVGLIGLCISLFHKYTAIMPIVIIGLAFIIIACGNNLYNILLHSTLRYLSHISFSIYLLHGLFLYVFLNYIIGKDNLMGISIISFFSLILISIPCLILFCSFTFHFIEKPCMNAVRNITDKTRILINTHMFKNKMYKI